MSNNSNVSFNTMQYIQNVLMRISIPYVIIVSLIGIAGNVLTLIMLSKRSLTKNFNNCTLIALGKKIYKKKKKKKLMFDFFVF
jgi:hypothetical protein